MTRALLAAGAALLLAACASFPPNPPLAKFEPKSGYSFGRLALGENNSNELFVILTFSGGGTRAAALAYGVLEELRATRIKAGSATLLEEVDVISSVSGGSFTAAYYALNGEKLFKDFPRRFLYEPIQTRLLQQMLLPPNWAKLAGDSYGRSDLAAEYYHRELFDEASYATLIERGRRPFVILNATDMTTGTPFPFTQDQFDLMCSDLAGVPIARAVASSSAFPGALTPLTFQNYAGNCGYRHDDWVENAMGDKALRINARRRSIAENRLSLAAESAGRPLRPYLHLTDGGVADNIGLRGPLDALTTPNHPWSVIQMMNNGPIEKLVVIAVNAATGAKTDRDQSAGVPGLIDTVITAAEVPLGNYSFDTIELMRKEADESARDTRILEHCAAAAARQGCTIKLQGPRKVIYYPVQVSFDYIDSPEDRAWFRRLSTNFELPAETVTRLREMGRQLLREDPQFRQLLADLEKR